MFPLAEAVLLCWQTPPKKSITTQSILVSVLVSLIFILVGYCSVVLLLNKELGKVKYCTIENHLYLWLALCNSTSSTGSSDAREMRLTQIKESQTKKMVQESKKSVFRGQYNSRWLIDGSSMSNQLHQWVIDVIDEWVIDRPQNFGASITHRLLIDHRQ